MLLAKVPYADENSCRQFQLTSGYILRQARRLYSTVNHLMWYIGKMVSRSLYANGKGIW